MELAKYLIVLWQGNEQAVTFPANVQHADMFQYIRRECPAVQAVSAGFFADEAEGFWHGGLSETLRIANRPQDGVLIERMLHSRDRRNWDLRVLVWEACETARRCSSRRQSVEMSMGA